MRVIDGKVLDCCDENSPFVAYKNLEVGPFLEWAYKREREIEPVNTECYAFDFCLRKAKVMIEPLKSFIVPDIYCDVLYSLGLHYLICEPYEYEVKLVDDVVEWPRLFLLDFEAERPYFINYDRKSKFYARFEAIKPYFINYEGKQYKVIFHADEMDKYEIAYKAIKEGFLIEYSAKKEYNITYKATTALYDISYKGVKYEVFYDAKTEIFEVSYLAKKFDVSYCAKKVDINYLAKSPRASDLIRYTAINPFINRVKIEYVGAKNPILSGAIIKYEAEKLPPVIRYEIRLNPLYEKYAIASKNGGIISSASDESSSSSLHIIKSMSEGDFFMQDLVRTRYGIWVYSILESLNISVVRL